MIIAKPVVPDQYWILKKDDRKVGNIEAVPNGYAVKIDNSVTVFKTLRMLRQQVPMDFEKIEITKPNRLDHQVHGYHTTGRPYNAVFDIQHQLPLWTREPRSRSWYAAGWYRVKTHRTWDVVECPKLIMLERYAYQGPFRTEQEAGQQ